MGAGGPLRRKAMMNVVAKDVGQQILKDVIQEVNRSMTGQINHLMELENRVKMIADTLGTTMLRLDALIEELAAGHTISAEEIKKIVVDRLQKAIAEAKEAQDKAAKEAQEQADKPTPEPSQPTLTVV